MGRLPTTWLCPLTLKLAARSALSRSLNKRKRHQAAPYASAFVTLSGGSNFATGNGLDMS